MHLRNLSERSRCAPQYAGNVPPVLGERKRGGTGASSRSRGNASASAPSRVNDATECSMPPVKRSCCTPSHCRGRGARPRTSWDDHRLLEKQADTWLLRLPKIL
ncbi:hypothetical protein EVAR_97735_1 [Eumeta japonica]|uniref:Uncharacterized protein n=1 Tax=Eumeta variegata TaxID=151549 RepID=A0A4C1X7U2_EUMVA|nr:hypothetical protein EVAR_97735_1 [Eumeta japonica]